MHVQNVAKPRFFVPIFFVSGGAVWTRRGGIKIPLFRVSVGPSRHSCRTAVLRLCFDAGLTYSQARVFCVGVKHRFSAGLRPGQKLTLPRNSVLLFFLSSWPVGRRGSDSVSSLLLLSTHVLANNSNSIAIATATATAIALAEQYQDHWH